MREMPIEHILPQTIVLNHGHIQNIEVQNYKEADRCLQDLAGLIEPSEILHVHVIVIFEDSFVWDSNIVLTPGDCIAESFLQRAIQSEWEFNAGVRPEWWPAGNEPDRMWGVHCAEDRHNGRDELARARLDRYDLEPIIRSPLPRRYAREELDPEMGYLDPPYARIWGRI